MSAKDVVADAYNKEATMARTIYRNSDCSPVYIDTHPYDEETSTSASSARALHNIDISFRRIASALESVADTLKQQQETSYVIKESKA
jgi:hypothetical protein